MQRNIASSLVGCVVYASLQAWNQSNVQEREVQVCDVYREVIKLLVSKSVVDVRHFVRAAAKILLNLRALHCYERCADLIKYLLDECDLDIWTCQEELHQISEVFLCYFYNTSSKKIDRGRLHSLVVQWFELVSSLGCDIQCIKRPSTSRANAEQKSFARFFDSLQATQRNNVGSIQSHNSGSARRRDPAGSGGRGNQLDCSIQARAALVSSCCCCMIVQMY